jgi:hypothetical protein
MERHPVYWALPAALVVHDAEEFLTMPAWVSSHRTEVAALLASVGAGDVSPSLPETFAQAGVAVACVLAVFLIVSAGVWSRPASAAWRVAYGGLLGAFFLHAFTHVAGSFFFGGYTPGVLTAVAVVAPGSLFIYNALARRGALAFWPTAIATVIALALFVPAALAAFSIAEWLTNR